MYPPHCCSQLLLHREGALLLKEGEMSRPGLRLIFVDWAALAEMACKPAYEPRGCFVWARPVLL